MTDEYAVTHGSFRIERTYRATPARVFRAFADPAIKRRWFAEGEGWEVDEFTVDFRVGGREHARFRRTGDPTVIENETVYLDLVPDRRITFAYAMDVGGGRISASLATVEITPAGGETQVAYTEQGAFFRGSSGVADREEGCRELFEKLAHEIE